MPKKPPKSPMTKRLGLSSVSPRNASTTPPPKTTSQKR